MLKKIIHGIDNWRYNIGEYNYFKQLLKSAKRQDNLNKTYVFNIVRNLRRSIDHEIFFALILALNGAKVKILLDDGVMFHWDVAQIDQLPNPKKIEKYNYNPYYFYNVYENPFSKHLFNFIILRNVRKKALKTYKDKNLEYFYYSQMIDKNNLDYSNLDELKKHAESSTIRFFKRSDLDYNDRGVRYYYYISLKNAIFAREIGKYVLKHIRPDVYVVGAGVYSNYGPTFEFLKKNGIKCLVYRGVFGHSRDQTDTFYALNTLPQTLTKSEDWKKYKNSPVTEEMIKKVRDLMEERTRGSTIDMEKMSYMIKERLFKINKDDGYKYHVAIFPNVIWDGNIRDRHVVFDDYLDWILTTINYVKNRKDIKLYVKGHPGELYHSSTTIRVLDIIEERIDLNNMENIVLIPSESKINPYEFLKSGIDLGIVYDGFMGLEIPLLGIPVITCVKEGFSSVVEGTFTVNSKEEYFYYLDNIDKIKEKFQKNIDKYHNNIIRYLYWYVFENTIKLPVLRDYLEDNSSLYNITSKDLTLSKKILEVFFN